MKKCYPVIFALLLFFAAPSYAQFFSNGADPAALKWYEIQTPAYRLIYPDGLDSLARECALSLEKYRLQLGNSSGYVPNGMYTKPLPVVLHPYTSYSNGNVAWAPRGMNLYTTPEAYSPESTPWLTELTIHEQRHVSQMQFYKERKFSVFNVLLGEMSTAAFCAIYGGQHFFEGDAVSAETSLTSFGRGRSADFLEYYNMALDNGDWRDWYKWRYSSLKRYTPNYYRLGYVTTAGMRYLFDDPLFTKRYYDNIIDAKGLPFCVLQKTIKQKSGKNFADSFKDIQQAFLDDWRDNANARAPFTTAELVMKLPRRHTEYKGGVMVNGSLYCIESGLTTATNLVKLSPQEGTDSLKRKYLRAFSSTTSKLSYSKELGKIFWSEYRSDVRWDMRSYSQIWSMDIETGKSKLLTPHQRYFNPFAYEDKLLVTEYPVLGGSRIIVLNAKNGKALKEYNAPDGMQIVESVFIDGHILVSAISDEGFGIFDADKHFCPVFGPEAAKIKQLKVQGQKLLFVSDRNGSNELYSFDLKEGKTERLSSTKYGASEFIPGEGVFYFSSLSPDGRLIYKTSSDDLFHQNVENEEPHHYKIADTLSEQEKELAQGKEKNTSETEISERKKYGKLGHLINFHSWAPIFFDFNNVAKISGETLYNIAGLGVTGLFQNELGTFYGIVGGKIGPDSNKKWKPSAHLHFTFTGWYPVIEGKLSFNDQGNSFYYPIYYNKTDGRYIGMYEQSANRPLLSGYLKTYIPFNFSSGGWTRGIIPQLLFSGSNDYMSLSEYNKSLPDPLVGQALSSTISYEINDPKILSKGTASLRGYIYRPIASSGIYPKWGIGFETGISSWLGLDKYYSPATYQYLYGYLPGIIPEHGIKITATAQQYIDKTKPYSLNIVSALPRGCKGIALNYSLQTLFTIDYAMALLPLDWSGLGPLAYVRNLELIPHFDYAMGFDKSLKLGGSIFSTGADLILRLSNLIWIPYDTRIGVSANYFNGFSKSNFTFNLVFGISI